MSQIEWLKNLSLGHWFKIIKRLAEMWKNILFHNVILYNVFCRYRKTKWFLFQSDTNFTSIRSKTVHAYSQSSIPLDLSTEIYFLSLCFFCRKFSLALLNGRLKYSDNDATQILQLFVYVALYSHLYFVKAWNFFFEGLKLCLVAKGCGLIY